MQYPAVEAILISTLVKRLIIDDVVIPLSIAAERRDGLHVSPKAVKEASGAFFIIPVASPGFSRRR
jgi:hypothetical protein